MLENQPESLINEAILVSLTSMDDSFVKLTRAGKSNSLYLHLARQRKCMTFSSSLADLQPRQKSLNENRIITTCLPEKMFRPSPSNCLVRLLSIVSQECLAVEQDSSLIKQGLASRENFRAMISLNELSGISMLIEDFSGKSARLPKSNPHKIFINSYFFEKDAAQVNHYNGKQCRLIGQCQVSPEKPMVQKKIYHFLSADIWQKF